MNLDELRSTQEKERRKDSLQHLRDSFYDDVAAYIGDLRASRDRRAERIDNPFADEEIRGISDEIDTAEDVAEALYQRRVGKVVKLASFAAADMPVDEDGMTALERNLYDDLVARIKENKDNVLDVLAGSAVSETAEDAPPDEPGAGIDTVGGPPRDEPVPQQHDQSANPEHPATGSDRESSPSETTDDSGMLADAMSPGTDSERPTAGRRSDSEEPQSGDEPPTQGPDPAKLPDNDPQNTTPEDSQDEEHPPVGDGDTPATSGQPSQSQSSSPSPSPSPDGGAVSADTSQTAQSDRSADQSPPETVAAATERSDEIRADTSVNGNSAKTPDSDMGNHTQNTAPASTMSEDNSATADPGLAAADSPESASQTRESSDWNSDTSTDHSSADIEARMTVRITGEVGEIFCVDEREYDLMPGDVVMLPELNAKPLLEQDAATQLD